MGRKILEIQKEIKDSRDPGGGEPRRGVAESEPRVDLSMGRKILEIPQENEGIRGSGGQGPGADSLNLNLG